MPSGISIMTRQGPVTSFSIFSRLFAACWGIVEYKNPPAMPLSQQRMDAIYEFPFTRRPHPRYTEKIPAYEMIKDSVTIMRGCFGGCTFCSITTHQGRIIQSRSQDSVIRELKVLAADPEFKGTVSKLPNGKLLSSFYDILLFFTQCKIHSMTSPCFHVGPAGSGISP